jgi:hypothetical protein
LGVKRDAFLLSIYTKIFFGRKEIFTKIFLLSIAKSGVWWYNIG